MSIFGIGTDIIEIARFKRNGQSLGRRFMERCFTEKEREHLANRNIENIAGYFAAKEAVAKALGTGFVNFWPNAIEIQYNKNGRPIVILHEGAATFAENVGITCIDISISHCKTYATAMAIAQI